MVRHRRKEAAFGPSPANNYTSGSGRKGFFGRFKRRGTTNSHNPNTLPAHATPDQVRQSYTTDTTAVGRESTTYKHGETGHALDNHHYDGQTAYPETGVTGNNYGHTGPQPASHRYNDGTYHA